MSFPLCHGHVFLPILSKKVYGVKEHTDPFPVTKDVLLQYKVKHEITILQCRH